MEACALNNLYVMIQKTMSSRKSEEDVRRFSSNQVFLKISQISQENIYIGVTIR